MKEEMKENRIMTQEEINREFIENYVKIKIKDKEKSIKLSPNQYKFLDWIEKCKKKNLNPFILKGKL